MTDPNNKAEQEGCLYYRDIGQDIQWFNWTAIEAAAMNTEDPGYEIARMLSGARSAGRPPYHVPIPRTLDEARAMHAISERYLKDNAGKTPDRSAGAGPPQTGSAPITPVIGRVARDRGVAEFVRLRSCFPQLGFQGTSSPKILRTADCSRSLCLSTGSASAIEANRVRPSS